MAEGQADGPGSIQWPTPARPGIGRRGGPQAVGTGRLDQPLLGRQVVFLKTGIDFYILSSFIKNLNNQREFQIMKRAYIYIFLILSTSCFSRANQPEQDKQFNAEKDLLVMQFDCKTDVDDIHSAAAFKTLLSSPEFSAINYFAVAGTYGIQKGLYVPPNGLFQQAFEDNWTDAHANKTKAVERMKNVALECLQKGGNVWIAEAGQSDFSAELIKAIQKDIPEVNTAERIHIVQHSDWNEEVTSATSLAFVKANSNYHKIPDGNVEGNGTPGFLSIDLAVPAGCRNAWSASTWLVRTVSSFA